MNNETSLAATSRVDRSVMPHGLAWSAEKPDTKGIYIWRGGPASVALVLVHKRPSKHCPGGVLKGAVIGSNSRFYDGCAITDWVGEWIGPLPE